MGKFFIRFQLLRKEKNVITTENSPVSDDGIVEQGGKKRKKSFEKS